MTQSGEAKASGEKVADAHALRKSQMRARLRLARALFSPSLRLLTPAGERWRAVQCASLSQRRCRPLSHRGHWRAGDASRCEPRLVFTPVRPCFCLSYFFLRDLFNRHRERRAQQVRWKISRAWDENCARCAKCAATVTLVASASPQHFMLSVPPADAASRSGPKSSVRPDPGWRRDPLNRIWVGDLRFGLETCYTCIKSFKSHTTVLAPSASTSRSAASNATAEPADTTGRATTATATGGAAAAGAATAGRHHNHRRRVIWSQRAVSHITPP